jgi:hypothetical protein
MNKQSAIKKPTYQAEKHLAGSSDILLPIIAKMADQIESQKNKDLIEEAIHLNMDSTKVSLEALSELII